MISRDPRCVFVADFQHEASLVLALLGEEGFDAEVVNDATMGGLDGLTGWVPRAGAKGLEVWVRDPAQAAAAREMLTKQMAKVREVRAARQARTGTVDVVCPSCGKTAAYPASQQGTVQSCVSCGKYLDVPDPDEVAEWAEEVGEPEDEARA